MKIASRLWEMQEFTCSGLLQDMAHQGFPQAWWRVEAKPRLDCMTLFKQLGQFSAVLFIM